MKKRVDGKFWLALWSTVVWLVIASVAAVPLRAQEPASGPAGSGEVERYVTIDFDDVDITLFIKYISELTGRNFIIDKAVRGNVTIISPTKISVDEAYRVFESVLEVQGFTTVPAGSVTKIVPSVEARSKSVETGFRHEDEEVTDKVVTQLIPLQYADPDELKKLFAPLVSKTSVVISYPATNLLIVTDVLSNINRLLNIVKVIDVEGAEEEIEVIPVRHASAAEIAKTLNTIFQNQQGAAPRRTVARPAAAARRGAKPAQTSVSNVGGQLPLKIMADDRTNILIVIGTYQDIDTVRKLVALLDKEVPRGEGDIRVVYLQHANAEELATVLTALPTKESEATQKGKAPTISKEVQIVADKATNSLVITAKKADFLALEDVIKKLDIPRRMVYLEALIMEVNADQVFEIGVQWAGGFSFHDGDGAAFSGFGDTGPQSLLNLPTGTEPLPSGLSLGVIGDTISVGEATFPTIGALVQALKRDSDAHIIATPQLITTDNQEAEIVVGQNVPYITSQNTSTAGQDYTNYEYKDVGTTLKITPQINQGGSIRMQIYTEVVRLTSSAQADDDTPTTFKRTASTTVIVEDQHTLVIGGIIDDSVNNRRTKIPILGDIPILGWAFRSHREEGRRTNLYIFLTPHIIRNPTEADRIYLEKKEEAEYHHFETKYGEPFKTKDKNRETRDILPGVEPEGPPAGTDGN